MTHFSCISRKIDLIERERKKTNYQWALFSRIIWFSKWNMQILCHFYQECLHRQITFSKLHTFFSCLSCCFEQKAFICKRILFFKGIPWNLWTKIAPQHEFIRYVKSAKKNSEKKLRSPLFSNFRFQSKWNNEHECVYMFTLLTVFCVCCRQAAHGWLMSKKNPRICSKNDPILRIQNWIWETL